MNETPRTLHVGGTLYEVLCTHTPAEMRAGGLEYTARLFEAEGVRADLVLRDPDGKTYFARLRGRDLALLGEKHL